MTKIKLALLYILLANAIWGIAPTFIKIGVNHLPPLYFLFIRFLLSTIIILPFFIPRINREKIKLSHIPSPFFIGIICYTVSLSLVFIGISKTTALDSVLIGSIEPLIVCLLGVLFLKEKISKVRFIGLIIALLGSLIIILEPLAEEILPLAPKINPQERFFGNFLIALFLITNGIYVIATRAFFKNKKNTLSPFFKLSIGFIGATITLFPLSMLELSASGTSIEFLTINSSTLIALLYMSLFSGIIAYLLFEKSLQVMEASQTIIFTYLQPIFALPASYLLLKEVPTTIFIIGAIVIGIGVLIAEKVDFFYKRS